MGWERSTLRITGCDTAQTERILMRLVDTSSLDSRLHHPGKRVFERHPCIEPVSDVVVSASVARTIRHSFWVLTSHMVAELLAVLIHGSTLCRQLKSCLRDWSIPRMKPCRQDNDKVQRNRRWQRPNNVSSSYPQEAVHLPRQLESSTRAHRASRRRSLASQRNGQPDNSRSRRLRVRRTQE